MGWEEKRMLEQVLSRLDHIDGKINRVNRRLRNLSEQENVVAKAVEDLTREVSENGSAVDSAIVLLNDLKLRLDEAIANDDMEAVQNLSDLLSSKTDTLAAAVAANTPAAPPAPTPNP